MSPQDSTTCSRPPLAAEAVIGRRLRPASWCLGLMLLGLFALCGSVSAQGGADCRSPRIPQTWSVEDPRSADEGDAMLLVRRQSERPQGGRGTELPVPVSSSPDDEPLIIPGDPASPHLFVGVIPYRGEASSVRLMVLCKSGDNPRVLFDDSIPVDFPVVMDTQAATEERGWGMAFLVGERHAMVWRHETRALELLDWQRPVRALALRTGADLRLTALLDDGSLWERRTQAGALFPSRAEPVKGWSSKDAERLLAGRGRVWLRDTDSALFAMGEELGFRFDRSSGRHVVLYGDAGERLAGWDRFFSRSGERTALFLLLGRESGGKWSYTARIFDLSRSVTEPVLELDVEDLLESERMAMPIILLQGWDEDFRDISGYVFHNPEGRGVMDRVEILDLWDASTRTSAPRLVTSLTDRQEFNREVLPLQVSVSQEKRRETVYFFADGTGFAEPFQDPLATGAGGRRN